MTLAATEHSTDYLRALPGDDVRQILWRFADRYDLQMLVQSVRAVARGPVARLVAGGARNTHEWTPDKTGAAPGLRRIRHHRRVHGPVPGRLHRRSQEPGARAGGLRARLGGRRRRHRQPGRMPGPLPHPRARHPRTARPLHGPLRPAAARRRPQALARRLLPHRAHPLRGRRNRHAGRQGARRRVEGRRGAHAARRKARPLHHQHGVRQLRDRRRGIGRPAHQGHLHGDPGRDRPRHLRPRHAHPQAGPPALFHPRPHLQPERPGQPHHRRLHREGRRDRAALQPRRNHRGGLPPHPRHGRHHDLGQAALAPSSR